MCVWRAVNQQRFVLEVPGREESLRRESMTRLHHGHELVVEQRMHEQTAVLDHVVRDTDVDRAVEEQFVDLAAGTRDDLHVHTRTRGLKTPQHLRQPVVLGIAAGGYSETARLAARETSNRNLGAFERVENFVGRTQEPLTRAREHHAFADAEKDLRAEMRLDIAQLMTERRLREVQLAPGARQSAERRHGAYEPEVPDFDIHVTLDERRYLG